MEKTNNSDDLNPVLVRLLDFIEEKGSLSSVARQMGRAANLFTNMRTRNSLPSVEVLVELMEFYPDLDVKYILTGNLSVGKKDKELAELTFKLQRSEAIIDGLLKLGKNKGTLQSPLVDREGSSDLLTSVINRDDVKRFVKILANVGRELAARNLN